MIYGDGAIRHMIELGCIQNASLRQINPASINIRLGDSFLRVEEKQVVTLGGKMAYEKLRVPKGKTFRMKPGEFVLATTVEKFYIPLFMAGFVQGRSSMGRIGLTVQNAGFIDPGFFGHLTLELVNESSAEIQLVPGYPVGQVIFFDVKQCESSYEGKYNGQEDATGSMMWKDKLTGGEEE